MREIEFNRRGILRAMAAGAAGIVWGDGLCRLIAAGRAPNDALAGDDKSTYLSLIDGTNSPRTGPPAGIQLFFDQPTVRRVTQGMGTPIAKAIGTDGKCHYAWLTAQHCVQRVYEVLRIGGMKRNAIASIRREDITTAVPSGNARAHDAAIFFHLGDRSLLADDQIARLASGFPFSEGVSLFTANSAGAEIQARIVPNPYDIDVVTATIVRGPTLQHGDSGSPVWNGKGELVGVHLGGGPPPMRDMCVSYGMISWAKEILAKEFKQ